MLEVRVETPDKVIKEPITIATFPYMPRLSRTRLLPLEVVDDFILETMSVNKARSFLADTSLMHVMSGVQDAQVVLEGIISENEQILQ